MRVLIRFVRRGPAGAVEQKDKLHDGESLTLGRATDQVVQLKDRRVALAHASIVLRGGQPVILSRVPGGVLVNGTLQREARLRVGDIVGLGANLLRILEAPAGCDLAFSFELDPEVRADELAADLPKLRLDELGLSKRRWSWALFLGVLLLALVIPGTGVRNARVQDTLRSTLWPDDSFWSPGPLSSAHETLAARCDACHVQPFQRVRNTACLVCHAGDLHQHVDQGSGARARGRAVTELTEARCASCHAEHHEPATLVRQNPGLCVACHRDLSTVAPWTHTKVRVTDFATDHPAFALPLRKDSGLKFSHTVHVAGGGIGSPLGDTVLKCAACHVLEPGGARFRPLQMQRDCGTCHLLDFDPAYPERTVPHGDARVVQEYLVDYFSRRYLESYADPLAKPRAARRAGPMPTAAEREGLLRQASERAALVTRDLFERRSCVQCHDVTRPATPADNWTVAEVHISTAWLPGARFSHAAHSTALTGCETCHAAARSDSAADVLLPAIDTCRTCHAGGDVHKTPEGRVTSTCLLCHGFHGEQNPLWRVARP